MSAGQRQGVIRLKVDQFDLITRVLKCDSDEARARLINVSSKTIYRARRGGLGQQLIAQTLINLRDRHDELAKYNLVPSFDELFEVVEVPPEPCHPGCPAFVVDPSLGRHK